MHQTPKTILLTVDVEDWFHVENLRDYISVSCWDKCESRVEQNVSRLLDLFDSYKVRNRSGNPIQATFFILGWIAEQMPHLVREIHDRGHEIASHGYSHNLCHQCSNNDFKNDLVKSKGLLEDIVGTNVYGYRAPNFSISDRALQVIKECGYMYDSSYNSFSLHKRYGRLSFNTNGLQGVALDLSEGFTAPQSDHEASQPPGKLTFQSCSRFYELPVSNLEFTMSRSSLSTHESKLKIVLPWGGGAYFRLMPFWIFRQGVKTILGNKGVYVFYTHPWEIDPGQPKVKGVSMFRRIRHYTGLDRMYSTLERFLDSFRYCQFMSCSCYLREFSNFTAVRGKGLKWLFPCNGSSP